MLEIQCIGNLGKDAKVMTTANGQEFITFSLAVRTGKDQTTWLDVAANHQPKIIEYLKKGREVFVRGALRVAMYNNQPQLGINGATIQLVGKAKEDEPKPEEPTKENEEKPEYY